LKEHLVTRPLSRLKLPACLSSIISFLYLCSTVTLLAQEPVPVEAPPSEPPPAVVTEPAPVPAENQPPAETTPPSETQPPAETPPSTAETTPAPPPAPKENPQPPAEETKPAEDAKPTEPTTNVEPTKPAESDPQSDEEKSADEKKAEAETNAAAGESAGLVDFQRDVVPLFVSRCLECHGPKQAKNDFRIDDKDTVLGYIEAGDSKTSSLVTDYLITSDEDSLMPPAKHGGPLATAELALIKLWIDEGAVWPDGSVVAAATESGAAPVPAAKPKAMPTSMIARVWAFQGFLHPATVHFPIALLILGALAAVGSFVPGWTSAEATAKFCLFFGATFSVVACIMGWSFADERGYGSWTNTEGEIFWHRLSGIVLAIFSMTLLFISWNSSQSSGRKLIWKIGMVLAAVIVGLVGHQGGELTYGKAMYDRAFEYLLK
jgi:uncharacterized membrane protein